MEKWERVESNAQYSPWLSVGQCGATLALQSKHTIVFSDSVPRATAAVLRTSTHFCVIILLDGDMFFTEIFPDGHSQRLSR